MSTKKVHFFNIDESGNTGSNLSDPVEPIHWLVAVGTSAGALQGIEGDMLAVASKYFGMAAYKSDFELHGADIFSGRKGAHMLTVGQRVQLYSEILGIVGARGAKIWVRGIHKERQRRRAAAQGYAAEHPYELGFMYLVESLEEWLEARQFDPNDRGTENRRALGLIVSDEQDEVSRALVSRFASWRHSGTDHGYRARPVRHLIDTVHYVKSQDSWVIQLADCVAYIRNRLQKIRKLHNGDSAKYNQSESAVTALWQEHCQPYVVDDRVWPL